MPIYDNRRCREAQLLMDAVLADVENNDLQLDSVSTFTEKANAFVMAGENSVQNLDVRKAVLDGIQTYERYHGVKPGSHLVAAALDQGQIYLDDALASGESIAANSRALVPQQALIAIKAVLYAGVPFAYYLQADKATGEAPLIIISHHAETATGMYSQGDSLNGLGGGNAYITTDRTHTLESADNTEFSGKITPKMLTFTTCDQDVTPLPLYPGRTQILINGLVAATTSPTKTDSEVVSGTFKLSGVTTTFTGKVNLKTGEVSVKFDQAVPEHTKVAARGYLNAEDKAFADYTPSVKTVANKYVMLAKSYRANVLVTPEAELQFRQELGVDPATEGTMMIRMQYALEHLYKVLNEATLIANCNGYTTTFDYGSRSTNGVFTTKEEVAKELVGLVEKISQEMANRNGSHGVSHIYVDDCLRALLPTLGSDYFDISPLTARPGSYRLGRLAGKYEVYYTPKGLDKGDADRTGRMLLIGANPANPAFNPFIFGEVGAPKIERINVNAASPESGYWVTGKNFAEQNPVTEYASSVALIDVINIPF